MQGTSPIEQSRERNVVHWLIDRHLDTKSDKTALVDSKGSATYLELYQMVQGYAQFLTTNGLSAGDRIALLTEESISACAFLLATIRCGLVICPLNPDQSKQQLIDSCQSLAVRLIVVDDSTKSALDSLSMETVNLDRINKESSKPDIPCYPVGWTQGAFCLFTSGTTGNPSAVIHRHQDILFTNLYYMCDVVQITDKDVLYSPSKKFFAYGLNSIHAALFHGATCILGDFGNKPLQIADTIERLKPSILFTVPTIYNMMIKKQVSAQSFTSLRLCISAGETLTDSLYYQWQEFTGLTILDGIGTTELLATVISNRAQDHRPGSTGKVVRGFEADIRDKEGRSLPSNQTGILWIKGPTFPDKYANNPDQSKLRFENGWFNTNDLFSRDDSGYFYYQGRASEIIKVGGLWLSPSKIESVINRHPDVLESAVVGKRTPIGLMRPQAFVVLRHSERDSEELNEGIKNFCKENLSKQEYPHFINFVDSLPRTTTGKIMRFKLADKTNQHVSLSEDEFQEIRKQGYNQIPVIERIPLGSLTPQQVTFACSNRDKILLESSRISEEDGRYSILVTSYRYKLKAKGNNYSINDVEYQGDPMQALRELMAQWRGYRPKNSPRFLGGAIGYLSYECNHYFEELPKNTNDDLNIPDLCFLISEQTIIFDHIKNEILLVSSGNQYSEVLSRLSALRQLVEKAKSHQGETTDLSVTGETADFSSNFAKNDYITAVKKVQDYILSGDTYQTNLSQRLEIDMKWTSQELYQRMTRSSPVHFASYIELDDFKIASASPERLVLLENGKMKTRPIAGTRRRGTDEEDLEFIKELSSDEKEKAEHCMLVDLERNDLGRVSKFGTVEVSSLMEIVKYSKVIHIESEVIGDLAEDKDFVDVIGALFPGGTITGVPKIRTMEIITELEPNIRSIYTGSIGYIGFAGDMDLNIVIRTAIIKNQKAFVNVGGGVVIDGNPEREYKETINKARSSLTALYRTEKIG